MQVELDMIPPSHYSGKFHIRITIILIAFHVLSEQANRVNFFAKGEKKRKEGIGTLGSCELKTPR